MAMQQDQIIRDIQHNCDISDARDHGIYSMCTMVLKLRNLYKWEHGIEPWQEAEPADLLDWIDSKEKYWQTIAEQSYRKIKLNGSLYPPEDLLKINRAVNNAGLVYGCGYGRSMKAVFFVAEKLEELCISGCRVIILGKELAKEMASPFAMTQEGTIYVRRESLRYFLWDQIQELRSSCRTSFRHALQLYGVLDENGQLGQNLLKEKIDVIVDAELSLFIYHEIGEALQKTLDSATLQKIIITFPASVIELVCRSIKDILADTHPQGLLMHLIREKRETSLSFYIGFLDGMRKMLFPEIFEAFNIFLKNSDWQAIEQAREQCRKRNLELARRVKKISAGIGIQADEEVQEKFLSQVVEPLGLDTPD
jgi:hypothetical protein